MNNNSFVKVANTSDIPVSKMKEVQINGQNICIANIDGKYFAINNICSHEGGPLADGKLEGYEVECPWHQSVYDMTDGRLVHSPSTFNQPRFDVRVYDNQIEVRNASQV